MHNDKGDDYDAPAGAREEGEGAKPNSNSPEAGGRQTVQKVR